MKFNENQTVQSTDNNNQSVETVLGGVSNETVVENTDTKVVTTTPGKLARNSREKREYTARGTTYQCRRVILMNGEPVGRGRPETEGKGQRRVVYIPFGMEYDAKIHGEGVKYNSNSHKATQKRIAKDSVSYVFDDGKQPSKNVNVLNIKKNAAKKKAAKKTTKKKVAKKTASVTSEPVAPVQDTPTQEVAQNVELTQTV
jgi:hypothetical protein